MSEGPNDERRDWSGCDGLLELAGHVLEFLAEVITGIDF